MVFSLDGALEGNAQMSKIQTACELADGLMLDPHGVSLVYEIVDTALADGKKQGLVLPPDDKEARRLLGKRVINAIKTGETDMGKLREMALVPTLT
jgi:hypothetical protein